MKKIKGKDGSIYEGEVKKIGMFKKVKHGKGTMTSSEGLYVGEFKNDLMDGQGTYTFTSPSGGKYVGEWRNDKFHGKGTLTMNDSTYVGEFNNGHIHGMGMFTTPDGYKYEGQYKKSQQHGQGILILHDGTKLKREFYKSLCIDLPKVQVINVYGEPYNVKEKTTKKGKKETLQYGKTVGSRGGISYSMEISIVNNKVSGWKDL